MNDILFKLLSPFRMVIKRWGPTWLKQIAWRSEFRRGRFLHNLDKAGRSRICDDIERYSNGGDILDLGCSDGHVALGLDLQKYRTYTGVDISEIGVAEAIKKCQLLGGAERSARHAYKVADISKFVPELPVDVFLFKDSLYYINRVEMLGVLRRLQSKLKAQGVFIVEMDNIQRHSWIRDIIRANFQMIEDKEFPEKDFVVLVFR